MYRSAINDSMAMSLSRLWELVMDREVLHAADYGVSKSWTQLSNQIELNSYQIQWFPDPLILD